MCKTYFNGVTLQEAMTRKFEGEVKLRFWESMDVSIEHEKIPKEGNIKSVFVQNPKEGNFVLGVEMLFGKKGKLIMFLEKINTLEELEHKYPQIFKKKGKFMCEIV